MTKFKDHVWQGRVALLREVLELLERELGRKWTDHDTLPTCTRCGSPAAPGIVGGMVCLEQSGRARKPHAVRLALWRLSRKAN